MKKILLASIASAMFWLSASSQSIVRIPVVQNPVFEVSTNHLDVTFPEGSDEMVLGAEIVIKGGSGEYRYLWTDHNGKELGNTASLAIESTGTYYLTITDTCDCEQQVTFNVATSSIHLVNASALSISPNPTDGYIRIEGFEPCQIVAVDMSGHIAAFINHDDLSCITEADLSFLSPGLYILTLTDIYNNSVAYRLIKK